MPAFVPEQHISANEFYLSEADAVTVASIFKYDYRSKAGSLSEESCNIKSVVHIESDGDTMIYAVNYDDGFVLVPANKSVVPVLSYSESGCFSGENCPKGMNLLINDYINLMEYNSTKSVKSDELGMVWG